MGTELRRTQTALDESWQLLARRFVSSLGYSKLLLATELRGIQATQRVPQLISTPLRSKHAIIFDWRLRGLPPPQTLF